MIKNKIQNVNQQLMLTNSENINIFKFLKKIK